MKKIILKSSVLMVAIFLSVLFVVPAMLYAIPIASITVTGAGGATTVVSGGSLSMSAAVLPADATDSSVTWSVADGTGTASIDATGVLTGSGVGTVTVTATANDGSTVTGTLVITVTVAAPTLVASITVTGAGAATTVVSGGSLSMSAAVLPADATDSSVTWSVADGTGTASIDATTGVLTGTTAGTVTVTATAHDGSTVTGTLIITVTAAPVLAQPTVNLGTTSSFAVLAGTTITNTGPTTISGSSPEGGGNVGLQPGSDFPGQGDVTMTGWTVYLSDPAGVALQAKNDLVTAYDDAAGRTPTTTFTITDNQLGGQTLKSGVYAFGHADTANLIGTLTLDAEGNENAVFIFQASSDLITASGSNVNLINGARYCRVFWQVTSSATLGTNSTFVGHIFALTSITATTGATVQGQLLARNGAVTLDTNTITNGSCVAPTEEETPVIAEEETTEETTAATAETTAAATAETTAAVTAETTTTETTPAPVTTTVTSGQIPKTATPWYNVLLAGVALILIGAMGWIIVRKINGKSKT